MVQAARVTTSPCLKYFNNVTGNFPGLRAAIRNIGLEPTYINITRRKNGKSRETVVIKVELSHDHLPEFYQGFIKDNSNFNNIYLVARTNVYYTPQKHLVFLLGKEHWGIKDNICWLDLKARALYFDLTANEWSWGRGRKSDSMSDI